MPRRRVVPALTIILLAMAPIGQSCSLPTGGAAPLRVFSRSITLAWDPPRGVLPGPYALECYFVYWRPHLGAGWNLLAQVPAGDHPEVRIAHDDLGDGAYDLAVVGMDEGGRMSPVHSSLDAEADPFGGWYLIWAESD